MGQHGAGLVGLMGLHLHGRVESLSLAGRRLVGRCGSYLRGWARGAGQQEQCVETAGGWGVTSNMMALCATCTCPAAKFGLNPGWVAQYIAEVSIG